jgi:hypothetical protein
MALAAATGLITLIGVSISTAACAESLAGQVGDKRRPMAIPPNAEGPCLKAYRDYIAAAGHSAYTSTRIGGPFFICGLALNVGSQKSAEERAMANCTYSTKKFKVRTISKCEIVASK